MKKCNLDKNEIIAKYAQMIIDEVHTKTCQNIQSALSGYYAHEADFYQETASLSPHAQQVVHKTLLYAVNTTISNFLFMLADHNDDPSRKLRSFQEFLYRKN